MIHSKKINLLRFTKEYLPLLIIVFVTANTANFLASKLFIFGLLITSGIFFKLRGHKLNRTFLQIALIWLIINFASYLFNQTETSFFRGTSIKSSYYQLFTAYFLLVLSGRNFFLKLEKIIYVLTAISLLFYSAELLLPSVMNEFSSPIPCNYDDIGGWYIGIYFHAPSADTIIYRNCGFMWEPGGFALMLILGIIIHFRQEGIKLDRRILIYIIAIATTLSTMGYLVMLILFALLIFRQKRYTVSFLFLILSIFIIPYILRLDFVMPEIEENIEVGSKMEIHEKTDTENETTIIRINRYAAMLLAIEESSRWPLGYGIIKSKFLLGQYGDIIYGVGAIQYTLIRWGWLGLIFLIISLHKSITRIHPEYRGSPVERIVFLICILLALFTNPVESAPLFYSLVFYPYVFRKIMVTVKNHPSTENSSLAILKHT